MSKGSRLENLFRYTLLALAAVACKAQDPASDVSSADSRQFSEQCGLVLSSGQDFKLKMSETQVRAIEPQDGASTNMLKDLSERKETACIMARWSEKDPVAVLSASAIRVKIKSTLTTEECGTLTMKSTQVVLQVTGNNSENNVNRVLEPQDGSTLNALQDLASRLTRVCVKGDFSKSTGAVSIHSMSLVREVK
ncbi:hypothetical protein EBU99_05965 [bacterium]|nr:hypothetical protein [bacterium]